MQAKARVMLWLFMVLSLSSCYQLEIAPRNDQIWEALVLQDNNLKLFEEFGTFDKTTASSLFTIERMGVGDSMALQDFPE